MQPKPILIKKYENRRLYDNTNSRYVNLDEVAKMLQNGDDVRVVDAATGEDITRLILTQIIVEDAKTPDSNFPIDVLRQMVIASGRASQESALKYMKQMLDIYQNTYRVMAPPVNPFEFVQRKDAAGSSVLEPVPPTKRREAKPESEAADVDELKQRVAELEALVSKIAPKKTPKKKK
jgi:polyhydroxyalkanoate synthesis repressor PhaR